MPQYMQPVDPEKAYRLLNIGATTLVSSAFENKGNIMAAAWACALDLVPFKASVVIARDHFSRHLIEKSGYFALSLPTVSIAKETVFVGSVSQTDDCEKLSKSGLKFFKVDGFEMPLPEGCAAWMIFKVIKEPHNESAYDLFIGECVAAFADSRVFNDGHYAFENAPKELRTLHYVAGGHFYAIGEAIEV